jgi:hypothetical protein
MNTCDICLKECQVRERLCDPCRETVERLAAISRELYSRGTKDAKDSAQLGTMAAIPWQFSVPRPSYWESLLRSTWDSLTAIAGKLHLWRQPSARKAAVAPTQRLGCYLNL